MNMIVAVDNNWGIGCRGRLLTSIPGDQRFFREVTTGNVIVLGRKTLETFPQGQPLKNRTNIILSTRKDYRVNGALVAHDLAQLRELLSGYESGRIYIVGGESVYRAMLPYCDTVHVTKIRRSYEADAYFPNLDESGEWEITADSEEQTYFDLEYVFYRYERKKGGLS